MLSGQGRYIANIANIANHDNTTLVQFSALAMLSGQGRSASSQQTHEMTVPNELIGCIIGKGGSKVAEIR